MQEVMDMATPDAVSAGFVQGSKRLLQAQFDALQVIRDLAANFRGVLGLAPETKPASRESRENLRKAVRPREATFFGQSETDPLIERSFHQGR